eukprot:scaffold72730_cov58-Phaeocystis_antarctica.AAC.2
MLVRPWRRMAPGTRSWIHAAVVVRTLRLAMESRWNTGWVRSGGDSERVWVEGEVRWRVKLWVKYQVSAGYV